MLKKFGIMICAVSMLFGGLSNFTPVLSVSDEVIKIYDESEKLAGLVINYCLEKCPEGLSGFFKELNKRQIKIVTKLFLFPEVISYSDEIVMSLSIKGVDLLVAAVQDADLELVKLIAEYFNIDDFINESNSCGEGTALWNAVLLTNDGKEIVDYLLSIGADPFNDYAGKGFIPELFEGHKDVVEPRKCLKEVFEKYGYYFIG